VDFVWAFYCLLMVLHWQTNSNLSLHCFDAVGLSEPPRLLRGHGCRAWGNGGFGTVIMGTTPFA
jgi:hypothetical protein